MAGGQKPHPLPGKWYWEPKANGTRALVHVPTGTMFNRHGDRLSITQEFTPAITHLREYFPDYEWLDCEVLNRRHTVGQGTIIVLDIVDPDATYVQRRDLLETLFEIAPLKPEEFPSNAVVLPQMWPDEMTPTVWAGLCRFNHGQDSAAWFYEGLVAKRLDSTYPVQLRSDNEACSSWIKHRYDW